MYAGYVIFNIAIAINDMANCNMEI